ncbi:translation initiation factor IF-3 [Bacteriovoracaceae bacterium]|nr:translation initiation factor IF-3 [Bacteriovoracaceae bacterium]
MSERKKEKGPRLNDDIRALKVRLIAGDGDAHGIVDIREARRIAEQSNLDLVEVSPNASPPVVKIIDYGKYKYDVQKKTTEAKKKQVIVHLKEIQFRPNIEKHDLDVKLKRVEKFLGQGDKVRLVMQFRGREIAYKKAGLEKFNAIIDQVLSFGGVVESGPKFMGSRILSIVCPIKKAT